MLIYWRPKRRTYTLGGEGEGTHFAQCPKSYLFPTGGLLSGPQLPNIPNICSKFCWDSQNFPSQNKIALSLKFWVGQVWKGPLGSRTIIHKDMASGGQIHVFCTHINSLWPTIKGFEEPKTKLMNEKPVAGQSHAPKKLKLYIWRPFNGTIKVCWFACWSGPSPWPSFTSIIVIMLKVVFISLKSCRCSTLLCNISLLFDSWSIDFI